MEQVLNILRFPVAMGCENRFIIELLFLRVRRKVVDSGELDLQHAAIHTKKYMVGIVEWFYFFAFDSERKIETAHIPDEKYSVICLKCRPTIFLLRCGVLIAGSRRRPKR